MPSLANAASRCFFSNPTLYLTDDQVEFARCPLDALFSDRNDAECPAKAECLRQAMCCTAGSLANVLAYAAAAAATFASTTKSNRKKTSAASPA